MQASESPNFYQQRDYKILPPEAVDARAAEEWWPKVPAIQDMPVNSVVVIPGSGETVSRRWNSKITRMGNLKEEEEEDEHEHEHDDNNDSKGKIYTKGYALPAGEDGPIVRVQISGDEGLTWTDARLLSSSSSSSSSSSTSYPNGGKNIDGDDDHDHDHDHDCHQTLNQDQVSKWAWTLWEAYVHVEPGPGRKILSRAFDKAGNTQPACPRWNFRGVAYNGYGEADGLTVV